MFYKSIDKNIKRYLLHEAFHDLPVYPPTELVQCPEMMFYYTFPYIVLLVSVLFCNWIFY